MQPNDDQSLFTALMVLAAIGGVGWLMILAWFLQ